jgi:diguanylate cyclase (GGDEF)-like protein/PAS domain S-box-containing protein
VGDGPERPNDSAPTRAVSSAIENHMGAAFANASTPMCVLDDRGHIVTVNESMERLLGRAAKSLIGAPWESVLHPDHAPTEVALFEGAVASGVASYQLERRLLRAGGEHVWCRTTTTALSIGSEHYVLVEALDSSAERNLQQAAANAEERIRLTTTAFQEELRRLAIAATTDQGTGLKNRRGFFALAQHELSVAQRLGHSLTLIFFDLDRLKEINDTLGHLEGDRAIADTAHLLSTTFRESDLIARLGGDEFCVLALGPPHAFDQTMRRFENALAAHNRTADRRYKLALSYGVAFYEPSRDRSVTLDELVSLADASMYAAKAERRTA